jgi:hypothetical protein
LLKIIYHVKSPYIGLKNVQKVFDKNPKMWILGRTIPIVGNPDVNK